MFVQLDRDTLVSRVSRTTPGRITFDMEFLGTVALYVLPLVLIVVSQAFPQVGEYFSSLIAPVTQRAQ